MPVNFIILGQMERVHIDQLPEHLVAIANGCPHVKTILKRFNSSTNLHKIQCSFRIGFTNEILTFKCSRAPLRLYLDSFV